MEYKVVEIKWGRDGNFYGAPPISQDQPQITAALTALTAEGWSVLDIQHDIGDSLRFSIVTLSKP